MDSSSRVTAAQRFEMIELLSNIIKTFDPNQVKYSIVAYHDKTESIYSFKDSRIDEVIQRLHNRNRRASSVRNLDLLFKEIDGNILPRRTYGNRLNNAMVIVMTTGNFNPSRDQSYESYKTLVSDRTIDVAFVDVGSNINHHQILGSSVLNFTVNNVNELPGLLSQLSILLARVSGNFLQYVLVMLYWIPFV